MPRPTRPVPQGFRQAVAHEGLGYHRLKKRFNAGSAAIKRWLKDSNLKTRNNPGPSLAAFNMMRQCYKEQRLKIEAETNAKFAATIAKHLKKSA